MHRAELINDSEYDIIWLYQGEYRGLAEYYAMATNRVALGKVRWVMETSLLKTLAHKNKTSVAKTAKRLQVTIKTLDGPRRCLRLTIQREKKKPLIATFGGISLKRKKNAIIKDQVTIPYARMRSEIVERLLNDTCEVCGATEKVEMHHIRKLADLKKKGQREKPLWVQTMIARKRKSLALCRTCHMDLHYNRPKVKRDEGTGEPDALKGARPVRRRARGKGHTGPRP